MKSKKPIDLDACEIKKKNSFKKAIKERNEWFRKMKEKKKKLKIDTQSLKEVYGLSSICSDFRI